MQDLRYVQSKQTQSRLDTELAGGTRQSFCKEDNYFILDRASFNQEINAQYDIDIRAWGAAPTVIARGLHGVAVPLAKSR